MLQDIRYGFRMLLKAPGVSAVAIVAMALGIGANTAIFSLIDAVLIRQLPYPNSQRLVVAGIQQPGDDAPYHAFGDADFLAWRDRQVSFEHVAAYQLNSNFSFAGRGLAEQVRGALVTPDFFSTLGVSPLLGRTFRSDEDHPGSDQVVVVSQNFWRTHLEANPKVVGRSIVLDGKPYTVVGVMPSGFHFPRRDRNDLWTVKAIGIPQARPPYYLTAFGCLKAESTIDQAQAELTTIASQVTQQFPASRFQVASIVPLKEFLVGDIRLPLLVLSGAVGLVLLIALVNVANLLLARATSRQKEMAVRRALGASSLQLTRQMLTESVLLSAIGGLAGLLLAKWGVDTFVALSPRYIPRLAEVGVNVRVLFFTAAISVLTGILFGLVPALSSLSSSLGETLKEGSRTSTSTGQRTRRLLVISEFALALMLLVGAGLLVRSFFRLQQVNPGFNTTRVLTMHISLPETRYAKDSQVEQFWLQLLERVQQLPGVEAVGNSMSLPPDLLSITNPFTVEGQGFDPSRPMQLAEEMSVSRDYFKALGIPLVRGRFFTEKDRGAVHAIIINEEMAKRYFPQQDPLGKRLQTGDPNPTAPWETIVGVVGNVKYSGLDSPPTPQLYVPFNAADWVGWSRSMYLAIHTSGNPASLVPAVRQELGNVDKDIPLANVATMDQLLDESVADKRFRTWLLGAFAALALLLASVGIYAVISYSVGQRTREFGVRMALGARPQDVLGLVLGQAARLAVVGLLVGIIGAFALTRTMSSLLFSVSTGDPVSFVVACMILFSVALLASFIPAWRATKVNPVAALRYE
ncbi:MAG TPA: ABC transporter permease [Terriglobales bacterium]|jgi:putative ABC transport system permease protein